MSRYFFHVDDEQVTDAEGTELPSAERAYSEAIIIAGEILRDKGRASWTGRSWQMRVTNEAGATLYKLRFTVDL